MTTLSRLNVSLTKHGAHKVAALLKKYEKDDVLDHLSGSEPGINIETAQARKTLAANAAGEVPDVWGKAKARGSESIDALVLLAIIFSHHELIRAMQNSTRRQPFVGRIERGRDLDGKAFTNFAHIIEELGFSTEHSETHVDYDLHKLFGIPGLNDLFKEMLAIKLQSAGWDRKNTIVEEALALQFNEVFSLSGDQLTDWLNSGGLAELTEDNDFFFNADDSPSTGTFKFRSGHTQKKTGTIAVSPSRKATSADLLHNEMQNALVERLCDEYGDKNVGSEQGTGKRTSIDVVVSKGDDVYWYYEIKTATSVKACIRQAIPQLLEYAYWGQPKHQIERLIIVGPSPITKEATSYLMLLRERFGLEIYYEQLKLEREGKSKNAKAK